MSEAVLGIIKRVGKGFLDLSMDQVNHRAKRAIAIATTSKTHLFKIT